MRLRRASPLLLLLASSSRAISTTETKDVLTNEDILALNRAPAQAVIEPKPYVGTKNAPVDGLDGIPHAGPFVDRTPDDSEKKKSQAVLKDDETSARTASLGAIPEKNDGVMDDDNRLLPKKGTTGTEGGISEKAKDKKLENKPKAPKEAPPLPGSEETDIDASEKSSSAKDAKDPITGKAVDGTKGAASSGDYGEAGYGMEKPKNLPEKPHNIPHPDPRIATSASDDDFGPPVDPTSGRDKWLVATMPDTEGKTNPRKPKTQPKQPELPSPSPEEESQDWHEWFHSFVLSFTMIIFSEIGDKTFLVAALMAMRHSRFLVFSAALSALIVMTVLSAVLGHAFPTLLPKRLTTFAAAILFLVFGARSLKEGLEMDKDAGIGEEMREVEAELEESEAHAHHRQGRKSKADPYELESGRREPSPPLSRSPSPSKSRPSSTLGGIRNLLEIVLSPAWVSTFIMTFLGEWGDRSQIATIAMAAGQDYWLVTLGAIVGHACCTGLAVVGGRALAGRVSLRVGKLCCVPS